MLLKLNIDEINRKRVLCLWFIFVLIIFSIYISTEIIVPKEFKFLHLGAEENNNNLIFNYQKKSETEFLIEINPINQFLLTTINPILKEKTQKNQNLVYLQLLYEVSNKNKVIYRKETSLPIQYKNDGILSKGVKNINLPYIFNYKENSLIFRIKLLNPEDIKDFVKNFEISVETNNEKFFYFFMYLKIFFFFVSIFTTSLFMKKYYQQLRQSRLTEQSLIILLGFFLILYNLPINFYYDEIDPNIFFLIFSSLINICFYSFVLYFWLITFEVF